MDHPTPDVTIDEAVRHHAATRPDDEAAVDPRSSLTWADLDRAANQVAEHLRARGVGPGDRVGWLGPNSVHYPPLLLGVWRAGAAIVGLNFRLPRAQLALAADVVSLRHLVADFRFVAVAQEVLAGAVTVVGPEEAPWDILEPERSQPQRHDEDAEAMIYFTSGSTGTPKAVPLTHRAVESAIVHGTIHHFSTRSRSLAVPPAFHVAGSIWTNYGLHAGATMVYTEDASPAGLVAVMRDQRVSHAIMVPTLIHSLVTELRTAPEPLSDLVHIGYGASPINSTLLAEALELLDCEFSQVYGMTEAGGGVTFLLAEDHAADPAYAHRLASAGRPGQDVEVEVRGSDGTVLPTGESGELWFRTPCLTHGYLGTDDPTGGVLVGGWLNTRDIGYLDMDGYVYVQGRADDMIQTGGENVHPLAVEEVLLEHPQVADAAVYGVAHEHWQQQVCAAVVPVGTGLSEKELIAFCKGKLAGYQVPRTILILDELPRTATGKVLRKDLAPRTVAHT
jgi:acyl-CoA synthetase (AMP-forming)/AMP-acid ligase II